MTVTQSIPSTTVSESKGARPAVKILLIGDEADVVETIKNLHRRGFAQIDSWSAPAHCDRAGKVIGNLIHDRYGEQTISLLTKNVG
ncbi:MAG: hypothetical protein AAF152_01275 [Cyanobacteria bacterium P01_A01_bin.114]